MIYATELLNQREIDKLVTLMTSGHPEAEHQIGQRIVKINAEPGDIHPNGTKGVVLGNLVNKNQPDGYLVQFDGQHADKCIFITGTRITKLENA